MLIRKAHPEDATAIANLMKRIQSELERPSLYIISDALRVQHKLSNNSYGFIIENEMNQIIAFCIFQNPLTTKPNLNPDPWNTAKDTLITELNYTPQKAANTMIADTIATRNDYRRQGLAQKLLSLCEQEAQYTYNKTNFITTIDPQNTPSRKNFEKAGYHPIKQYDTFATTPPNCIIYHNPLQQIPPGPTKKQTIQRIIYEKTL